MAASLIGRSFGRLQVVAAGERHGTWQCACECGGLRVVHGSNLTGGRTSSCGCLWRERVRVHGASGSPTYKSWSAMVNRCTNPNDPSFHRYGAAGITVAAEWMDFRAFVADMGQRPAGTTLDRIDPFGGYSKANCRWATAVEQARNHRRPARLIDTPHGPMRTCEAAEVSGIPQNVIRARLRLKWPAARLFDPINLAFSRKA